MKVIIRRMDHPGGWKENLTIILYDETSKNTEEFIIDNFSPDILECYDLLVPETYKADFLDFLIFIFLVDVTLIAKVF